MPEQEAHDAIAELFRGLLGADEIAASAYADSTIAALDRAGLVVVKRSSIREGWMITWRDFITGEAVGWEVREQRLSDPDYPDQLEPVGVISPWPPEDAS